jgi:hypothetical protein
MVRWRNFVKSYWLPGLERRVGMRLEPDPDFEDFARDCLRLAGQEKSPILRRRLLNLAREWMHVAMHHQGAAIHRERTEQMDANSGEPWSEMDIQDLRASLDFGNTYADAASMLCRDEDEVRQKAKELGLVEHRKKW